MSNPQTRGWGDPTTAQYAHHIKPCTAGGFTVQLHELVVPIFLFLNTQMAEHYPLAKIADEGGRVCRPIRGREKQYARTKDPKWLSLHSWGLAEDLDSSSNPMTTDPHAVHEFLAQIVHPILEHFGGRLVWGGDYTGDRKDYMHFEYIGTPEQAIEDSKLAMALQTRTKPAPIPAWFHRELHVTSPIPMRGADVHRVRQVLGLSAVDENDPYSADVAAAVRRRRHGQQLPDADIVDHRFARANP
jgi:hypothetical protein